MEGGDLTWLDPLLECPLCRGSLAREMQEYCCENPQHKFPIRFGIPDFRVAADPFISREAEQEKVARILGAGACSFDELVDRYYQFTPEVAPTLQSRYRAGLRAGVRRGRNLLATARNLAATDKPLLELGCGTGGLLVAGRENFGEIVGIDQALRWLVIGRQRLLESGLTPRLVCANAEALPFKPACFGGILSDSVLEHSMEPEKFLHEARRVCRPGGAFLIQTVNRNSLLDPYTGFPFPGLFPRRLRCWLIERLCRTPCRLNPLSFGGLQKLVCNFPGLSIRAHLPLADYHAAGGSLRALLIHFYQGALRHPWGNAFLARFGLFLLATGRFPPTASSQDTAV